MSDLESVVEQQLIDKLCSEESQWTFRDDLRTEEALWANFKYILEQNNKDILEDQPLSDIEFQEVKNSVSHASFYEAGQWLIGENGKVYVTVHRNEKELHLLVLNNEHIAGGTSVYEVIHQYQSPKTSDNDQNRRFDVTLLINGLPLIHIELKNKKNTHQGCLDAFYQIRKYIGEGKFTGLFSNVQMFVISNETETKYFAPARASELNKEFLTGWVDSQNQPVHNYLEFANEVLRIPLAHEMVTKYTVLDAQKKQVLILRPYQIHAIEAMRKASKENQSGFIWHTTGSGKTITSYKATRNLLMDIPSLDKTVFLIDRQDLDLQTTTAFQAYAESDTIDVEDTDNVQGLIKQLSDGKRDMIVTTRQKLQHMINTRFNDHALEKGGSRARQQRDKIRSLRIAFVVDECHRAVTPQTKRDIERFFSRSLWFGFTGTPIFASNKYEKKGDLSQTTEELYGPCLHSYTIKEAIDESSVLGFSIECLGPQGIKPEEEEQYYQTQKHMRNVLNVILNKSTEKFGLKNGSGRSYVAMLTVDSIAKAQDYYALLKKIKCGEDTLRINENITNLPKDFPKVAITFSITENDESSKANQDAMKSILEDYNHMFGTSYTIEQLRAYNNNLNERLARKKSFYLDREQQIDLVIVVDRLLTGFDAPCLSTLFIDRPPMKPQGLIQAFSRTNRIFDTNKEYGQIVTFRSPHEYKESIDAALKLYSRGDFSTVVAEDWDTVLQHFSVALRTVHTLAPHPEDALNLSREQKKNFVLCFRSLDHDFAHLKSFTCYTPTVVEGFDFSQDEYDDYAANYKTIIGEFNDPESDDQTDESPIIDDYDLVAFDKFIVDYDYLVRLLQGVFDSVQSQDNSDSAVIQQKIIQLRDLTTQYADNNQKLSQIIFGVLNDCEKDPSQFAGKDASYLIYQIRSKIIREQVQEFANTWFLPYEDVDFAVTHFKNGHSNNQTQLEKKADYSAYKRATDPALPKFRFYLQLKTAFNDELMPGILPLL